jgi:hypothetical protein
MSFIADAHRQWHMIYGQDVVCPLDCGAGEVYDYDPDDDLDPDTTEC